MDSGARRPYGIIAALTLSLATAIAAAAWLIATQEVTGMTATSTSDAQTTMATASTPAPPATATAAKTAGTTANAAQAATNATRPATQQAAAPVAPAAPSAPSAAGQRAFIDPATGEFRPAEHDEVAALNAAAAASAPARRSAAARTLGTASTEFFVEDGSVGAVVPKELHTFTVATRGPDGRIVIQHAQGAKNADKLVKASRTQQKEDRNDR